MSSGSSTVVIKAFAANLGIASAKFVVAIISRSSAMLSEAVHSLADSGNQLLLLLGMRRSQKPEDYRHEFGYASEGYFWAFIVAVSLFTMGATFSIYEGVERILHRHGASLGDPKWAYIVLGISTALELYSLNAAYTEFKQFRGDRTLGKAIDEIRDAALVVVLFEDAAALAGLLLAFIGVLLTNLTGDAIWDGVASIMVGGVLFAVATTVALKTKGLLVGEAVTTPERQKIIDITVGSPGVRKLIHLRTLHLGAEDVIVAMKVAFDDDATTKQIAEWVDQLEAALRGEIPKLSRIYVEVGTLAERPRTEPAPARPHEYT